MRLVKVTKPVRSASRFRELLPVQNKRPIQNRYLKVLKAVLINVPRKPKQAAVVNEAHQAVMAYAGNTEEINTSLNNKTMKAKTHKFLNPLKENRSNTKFTNLKNNVAIIVFG